MADRVGGDDTEEEKGEEDGAGEEWVGERELVEQRWHAGAVKAGTIMGEALEQVALEPWNRAWNR